jgi:hypothetical protein
MQKQNVAGMSLGGGRKDNFFFCLLEFFPDQKRWFLTQLNQVKDEVNRDGNEATLNWINDNSLGNLIIDFPLSHPPCHDCVIECPGTQACSEPAVVRVRSLMQELIKEDRKINQADPKEYERERNKDNEFDYSKDILKQATHEHLLSKSFKRRLKKGFLPYWNRPIDVWIWYHYYDQLLNIFKTSYDSFGTTSIMLMNRFHYLKRHFPQHLKLHESDVNICLIELLRQGYIQKKLLVDLHDIVEGVEARQSILKKLEKDLGLFIYQQDYMTLVKNPKAFDSFLLALVGKQWLEDKSVNLPEWTTIPKDKFIIPQF